MTHSWSCNGNYWDSDIHLLVPKTDALPFNKSKMKIKCDMYLNYLIIGNFFKMKYLHESSL